MAGEGEGWRRWRRDRGGRGVEEGKGWKERERGG